MKKVFIFAALLSTCFFPKAFAGAPAGYVSYLDVTAKIDGSDAFELVGNSWRWQHFYNAPPEQHDGFTATLVNGQSFGSSWPSGTSYGSYSSYNEVTGLQPIQDLFGTDVSVYLEVLSGRGPVSLEQAPTAANGYTLRVFMNDDGYGSHDFYHFQIWADGSGPTVTPEPVSASLFLLGGGFMALRRFRRKK